MKSTVRDRRLEWSDELNSLRRDASFYATCDSGNAARATWKIVTAMVVTTSAISVARRPDSQSTKVMWLSLMLRRLRVPSQQQRSLSSLRSNAYLKRTSSKTTNDRTCAGSYGSHLMSA